MRLQTYRAPAAWREGMALEEGPALDKEETHRRGLLHRSVHLLALDGEGRVLARRRSPEEPRYAGLWTSTVGTHVPAGATNERTLQEVLPSGTPLARVGEFRVHDEAENEVCGLFVTTAHAMGPSLGPIHAPLRPDEIQALAREGRTTPHLAEALRRYLQGR